jgi:hypothetical protein
VDKAGTFTVYGHPKVRAMGLTAQQRFRSMIARRVGVRFDLEDPHQDATTGWSPPPI